MIAAPLYEKAEYLPGTVESLLALEGDFALLLVDDCSSDGTFAAAERYAADSRVTVLRNERRLGLTANRRRCYELARRLHPEARYFAWGSDHDRWRPGWLAALSAELDADPGAVLAYPHTIRIDAEGRQVRDPWSFDTRDVESKWERLRLMCGGGTGLGDSVYGLYRVSALDRTGGVRDVLAPDRLLIAELALEGRFVQTPEVLWERRFVGLASVERQRSAFFPDGPPLHARLPSWWVHTAILLGARGPRVAATFARATAAYRRERSARKRETETRRAARARST